MKGASSSELIDSVLGGAGRTEGRFGAKVGKVLVIRYFLPLTRLVAKVAKVPYNTGIQSGNRPKQPLRLII